MSIDSCMHLLANYYGGGKGHVCFKNRDIMTSLKVKLKTG